jgi:hypothetical protein
MFCLKYNLLIYKQNITSLILQTEHIKNSLEISKVLPMDNQKPYIKEGQTIQWPKKTGNRQMKDRQNTTQKLKNEQHFINNNPLTRII